MLKYILILTLTILVTSSTFAQATMLTVSLNSKRELIAIDKNDKMTLSIVEGTIELEDSESWVWVNLKYTKSFRENNNTGPVAKAYSSMAWWNFDCTSYRMRIISSEYYDKNGALFHTKGTTGAITIVPESIIDRVRSIACYSYLYPDSASDSDSEESTTSKEN